MTNIFEIKNARTQIITQTHGGNIRMCGSMLWVGNQHCIASSTVAYPEAHGNFQSWAHVRTFHCRLKRRVSAGTHCYKQRDADKGCTRHKPSTSSVLVFSTFYLRMCSAEVSTFPMHFTNFENGKVEGLQLRGGGGALKALRCTYTKGRFQLERLTSMNKKNQITVRLRFKEATSLKKVTVL